MVHFELGRTGWPSRMRYLPRALHDREPPIPAPLKCHNLGRGASVPTGEEASQV